MTHPPRISVAGAGSIGCFVGGLLADQGHDVRFLGRSSTVAACATHGLRLTDYSGLDVHLRAPKVSNSAAQSLGGADIVLVCVKSGDTAQMGAQIAEHAPDAVVISLQNGVANAACLRDLLPHHDVRAAMVPFNVVPTGPGAYHRATSGDILFEAGPLPDLDAPTLRWRGHPDIAGVQWGKLLINLGNAVNALADIPLLEQLQDRRWRRLMADQMAEALRVLKAAGITPLKSTAAKPQVIPHILRLPTPLFRLIAAQMLTIDAQARSSMWDDLNRGRKTEIDALQGAILDLAARYGRQAPLNARMHALIRAAEAEGEGPPGLSPGDIRP
ncbi:2-dehydropantoate 2-reductase [uncultured Tateyamaria sp.]|uniref:2-dehydropantoate 2-reductase n=1 Tax=uncultured Tateyamaria sp. TaxID=455651 RepID=UPI00260DD6F1|nr:2-dehydropantoate 2-reductase [uncultured Tateyamaria sp.]